MLSIFSLHSYWRGEYEIRWISFVVLLSALEVWYGVIELP